MPLHTAAIVNSFDANEFWRALSLQEPVLRPAMLGVGALGLCCGVVGCFTVLRGRALVSDAVAHCALPGIWCAFSLSHARSVWVLLAGALAFGLLGAGILAFLRGRTRVKDDALLAIIISSFFGLGIVLSGALQRTSGAAQSGLENFVFGRAAAIILDDVYAIAAVGALTLAFVIVFFNELRILCFDPAFAIVTGRPVRTLDLALLALLCLTTVSGLPAVGVLMIVALMVIPPTIARLWTDRFALMLMLAGAIGCAGTLVGGALSASWQPGGKPLFTGATIVLALGAAFIVSAVIAPRGFVRRVMLAHRVQADARAESAGDAA